MGYSKTFQQHSSIFNKPPTMVRRIPNRASSGSELEDDANPQLAQMLEAVCELQECNVEQQKESKQAEAQAR